MPNHKHIMIVAGVALVAGFVLANAPSGTGIYANKIIGQTAANIYVSGHKLASPAAVATGA